MAKFREKAVMVEATQWFKNGDHPLDYSKIHSGYENSELRQFHPAERKSRGFEGDIVRYFRRPDVDGQEKCKHCGKIMHEHGWIGSERGYYVVCPGDWIITADMGDYYPCKPDIFNATYEAVE